MNERLISNDNDVTIGKVSDEITIIDDREFQMFAISEICGKCANLSNDGIDKTCRAFPNGIPLIIWNGKNNHKKQYPGDNNITFKEK